MKVVQKVVGEGVVSELPLFKVFFGFFYGRSVFVIVICGEYFSTQPVFFGSSFMFISRRYFIYLSKKYN